MTERHLPVHEGFEQDKQDYWAMRDELLKQYRGKWVAVHKGKVVAVGDDPLSISDEALAEDGYAYCNCVGREDEIVFTIRRVQFPYDTSYLPRAIPRATVTVFNFDQRSLIQRLLLAFSCLREPLKRFNFKSANLNPLR